MSVAKPRPRKLMVVEDDAAMQTQLRWSLSDFSAVFASKRDDALAHLRADEPPVVLLDLGLPPDGEGVSEGFRTLSQILDLAPHTKVVVLTGREGREHAQRAVAGGAHDYCQKPMNGELLASLLNRAFYLSELEAENRRLQDQIAEAQIPGMIGDSPAALALARTIERVAPADVSVVLLGESGTGKEVTARALHRLSSRMHKRFVAINCAAIPPALLESELFGYERGAFTGAHKQTQGKIETANGGTLFLDEIGDLSPDLQAKLLRFLQERVVERIGGRTEIAVDARVVCATHRDLELLVSQNGFREDLYYRLSEFSIPIPPLRDRIGDAVLLAQHFLNEFAEQLNRHNLKLTPEALSAIDNYAWPGNVRELQNRMKRAIILADAKRITPENLGLNTESEDGLKLNLRIVREEAELTALKRAIARTHGNVSKAAKLLGISRPTLYDLMRQHQIRG